MRQRTLLSQSADFTAGSADPDLFCALGLVPLRRIYSDPLLRCSNLIYEIRRRTASKWNLLCVIDRFEMHDPGLSIRFLMNLRSESLLVLSGGVKAKAASGLHRLGETRTRTANSICL